MNKKPSMTAPQALIGTWTGDKGMDVAPEPGGSEENPYFETIVCEAIGDVTHAEKQTLAVVRYLQRVSRKSNGEVFLDETGYWMWDGATHTVMHSLVIPRAVAVLAGGRYRSDSTKGPVVLDVAAKMGDADWGILQSPFMGRMAKTLEFRHHVEVDGDKMRYDETTVLDIYGEKFDHTDKNELTRQG